jgi:hypothetical protein
MHFSLKSFLWFIYQFLFPVVFTAYVLFNNFHQYTNFADRNGRFHYSVLVVPTPAATLPKNATPHGAKRPFLPSIDPAPLSQQSDGARYPRCRGQ